MINSNFLVLSRCLWPFHLGNKYKDFLLLSLFHCSCLSWSFIPLLSPAVVVWGCNFAILVARCPSWECANHAWQPALLESIVNNCTRQGRRWCSFASLPVYILPSFQYLWTPWFNPFLTFASSTHFSTLSKANVFVTSTCLCKVFID